VWGRRGREARILCLSTVTKPAEEAPFTYWAGFRVGLGAILSAVDNTKLSLRLPGIELLILSSSSLSVVIVVTGCRGAGRI